VSRQEKKAADFRALHEGEPFVIPNPWDAGSARVLEALGFAALATTSSGFAFTLGLHDGGVTLDQVVAHVAALDNATELPLSVDLEHGYGDPAGAIARIAEAGAVGGSIEDYDSAADRIYDRDEAVERVTAAVEAARALAFPFTLTARAENFVRGHPDLDDTIRRLQAFERAGADVLFAPGLPDLDAVRTVCSALARPVNFMVGIRGKSFTVAELAAAGVRRVSLATSLYRAALSGLVDAAREIRDSGTFGYVDRTMTSGEFVKYVTGK